MIERCACSRSPLAWMPHQGEPGRAREWYRHELRRDPGHSEARDSLAALDRKNTP